MKRRHVEADLIRVIGLAHRTSGTGTATVVPTRVAGGLIKVSRAGFYVETAG